MRAIRYRFSIPNYLATKFLYRWSPDTLASHGIPGLEQVDLAPAELPGPDWLRLRPLYSGICGSDTALLTGKGSPALTPFISFPMVPGHEIVAEVAATGSTVTTVSTGDRVVVDPFISCQMRGLNPCSSCRHGEPSLCTGAAEGDLSPGMLIGFCRDLAGGWSQEMIVHQSQVYPVPAAVPTLTAVLVEPLSVAIHAILKSPPEPDDRVLIISGGSVGLSVLAALRLLGITSHTTILVRYPFQEQLARKLGADAVSYDRNGGEAAVKIAGAREYRPLIGKPVYMGGFDRLYDCAGTADSVDQSMRYAGAKAGILIVGCAAQVPNIDLSFIWSRELNISGSYGYSKESSLKAQPHTFQVALQLLAENPTFPLADLITHQFPLSHWREALRVTLRRNRHRAVKTVFNCQD